MRKGRDPSSLADEELMLLVAARDARAFEAVYDRHGGVAYSVAHRIVGTGPAAEDVVQEAFLSIWRSRDSYDTARGSVRSWILSVVRNRAIDHLRRRTPGGAPRPQVLTDELLEMQPARESTDAEALRRETARSLKSAVSELPDDQSKVIELAYFGGFTHSEIAELMNLPLGTVKGRMRLGLEKMRARLAEGTI